MDRPAPELVARFEELAEVVGDADRKLVFGCPSCLVGGNMFFGVHATGLFVRLPEDAAAALLEADGVPFEPMPGAVGTPVLRLHPHVATEEGESEQRVGRQAGSRCGSHLPSLGPLEVVPG